MERREIGWAIFLIIAVLSAYIAPYSVLREVDAWYGSFLFWSLFGLLIIAVNVFITRKWSE